MESIHEITNQYLFPGIDSEILAYLYDPAFPFEEKVKLFGDTPVLWPLFELNEDANKLLQYAAKYNHFPLVLRAIELDADDLNRGLEGAAEGGHSHLVDWFIAQGAHNLSMGMRGAARGGHFDLVDWFLEQGAYNWSMGIQGAQEGGYNNLVVLLALRQSGIQ